MFPAENFAVVRTKQVVALLSFVSVVPGFEMNKFETRAVL